MTDSVSGEWFDESTCGGGWELLSNSPPVRLTRTTPVETARCFFASRKEDSWISINSNHTWIGQQPALRYPYSRRKHRSAYSKASRANLTRPQVQETGVEHDFVMVAQRSHVEDRSINE